MSTIWKTTETNRNKFTGQLSCWSRQQKLAIIASLVMLGILLAVSACSKQSQAPTTGGVSASAPNSLAAPAPAPPQRAAAASPSILTATKKSPKKRPATVTYKDAATGVSFVYPRKFVLATGEKARPRFDDNAVPMNFTQSGGATVATVALPKSLYPGTDFATGFFSVNVNQGLAEEECFCVCRCEQSGWRAGRCRESQSWIERVGNDLRIRGECYSAGGGTVLPPV